jgi:hypothetical protein
MSRRFAHLLIALTAMLSLATAADTLPSRYTDAEFWRMVTDFSEPGGNFPYENFVSNELSYQIVLPELKRVTKPGGVYLGVAPEQNFTYIAALQPKVAFILDIRRQNMIELLMYKALFEISQDRADFVSKLFSRPRPPGLGVSLPAQAIFRAFDSVRADPVLYRQTLQAIKDNLVKQHQFKLIADDEQKIDYILNIFLRGGPGMDYSYASASPAAALPSYYNLMIATDGRGENWAYLQTEDRYRFIRDMQQRNLIVPLVGDFGGPKTLKAIATYLKNHGATVTAFYISNVEDYLQRNWADYKSNLAALPFDNSSYFIRFVPRTTVLRRMSDVPPFWPGRNWD